MFEQKSAKETILELHSSAGNGLSEAEARKRLEQNGKNELKEGKKKSVAEAFFEQLNDPLIYVLLVAVIISLLLHEVSDAMIILVVVTVNAVVGVIQEGKAQKALEALKGLTIPKAIVKREGRKGVSSEVVGDNWMRLQIPRCLLETVKGYRESLPVERMLSGQNRKHGIYVYVVITGLLQWNGQDWENRSD
ncbi:MAG: cation-transporting P-type ATPase [Coprococcus phoceensis]